MDNLQLKGTVIFGIGFACVLLHDYVFNANDKYLGLIGSAIMIVGLMFWFANILRLRKK